MRSASEKMGVLFPQQKSITINNTIYLPQWNTYTIKTNKVTINRDESKEKGTNKDTRWAKRTILHFINKQLRERWHDVPNLDHINFNKYLQIKTFKVQNTMMLVVL